MKAKDFQALLETVQRTEITVARIEERQVAVVDKLDISATWQKEHEIKDEERFSNLNKYAASVAMVGATIGACATYLWNRITGQA